MPGLLRVAREVTHLLAGELQRIQLVREVPGRREVRLLGGRAVSHRLRRDVSGHGATHLDGDREHLFRAVQAVDPDDVCPCIGELARAVGGRVALVRHGLGLLEAHRGHHRQPGELRALDEQDRLLHERERLADPEVHTAGVELVLELPVEQRSDVVGARRVSGVVRPREAEVPRDERVTLGGHLPRDLHGVAVDVVDLVGEADRGELVVARVERHRLEHIDAGAQELAVELLQGVRVLDHHLGRERSRLHVSALLQLQQVAAIAKHGAVREPFQDALRHIDAPSFQSPSDRCRSVTECSDAARRGASNRRDLRSGANARSSAPRE